MHTLLFSCILFPVLSMCVLVLGLKFIARLVVSVAKLVNTILRTHKHTREWRKSRIKWRSKKNNNNEIKLNALILGSLFHVPFACIAINTTLICALFRIESEMKTLQIWAGGSSERRWYWQRKQKGIWRIGSGMAQVQHLISNTGNKNEMTTHNGRP